MIEFDVCLEPIFPNLPYDERIRKIADAGFEKAEFWFHDSTCGEIGEQPKDVITLRKVCRDTGVSINNVVVNSPDGSIGGSPVKKSDISIYLGRLVEVMGFARLIGCNKAITCAGNEEPGTTRTQMRSNLEKALAQAAEIAERQDFMLLLEPLNISVDHPGYFLQSSYEAGEIIRDIGSPNFKLLYDIYHMQIMEGNIMNNIERNMDIIGHFHAAGVPGRGEVFDGELNYAFIIKQIKTLDYNGSFGLEYFPKMQDHNESLRKTREFIESAME